MADRYYLLQFADIRRQYGSMEREMMSNRTDARDVLYNLEYVQIEDQSVELNDSLHRVDAILNRTHVVSWILCYVLLNCLLIKSVCCIRKDG